MNLSEGSQELLGYFLVVNFYFRFRFSWTKLYQLWLLLKVLSLRETLNFELFATLRLNYDLKELSEVNVN